MCGFEVGHFPALGRTFSPTADSGDTVLSSRLELARMRDLGSLNSHRLITAGIAL